MTPSPVSVTTVAVLGGRYVRLERVRTHAYRDGAGQTLCGRIKAEGLADRDATDPHAIPSCPTCAARDPRRTRPLGTAP